MAQFKKKKIEHKMCVLIFSTSFVWNTSHFRKEGARYDVKTYIDLHVNYLLFLSDLNETWSILKDLQKILKYHILWKSARWEPSCSMRTDRETDMTKLRVIFHIFSYKPNHWEFWDAATLATAQDIKCQCLII